MCDSAELGWLNSTWFQVINIWSRPYFSFCQGVFSLLQGLFFLLPQGFKLTHSLPMSLTTGASLTLSFCFSSVLISFLFFFSSFSFSLFLVLGFFFLFPPFLSEYSYILYSDYIPLLYINKYMHDSRKINCFNILHLILSYPIIKSQYLTARGLCSCQDGCAVHISCHFVYIISYMHTLVS